MQTKAGKFSFEVPEGHPDQGQKVEKAFEYQECESDEEAVRILGERKWPLVKLVNDKLRTSARANGYQNALAMYRRSDVSAEDAKRAIVRNLIGLGMSESDAIAQADAAIAKTQSDA